MLSGQVPLNHSTKQIKINLLGVEHHTRSIPPLRTTGERLFVWRVTRKQGHTQGTAYGFRTLGGNTYFNGIVLSCIHASRTFCL